MELQKLLGTESSGPDTVDALVLPFAYEATVSYGGGTRKGPETILHTIATQVEWYDCELKQSPCEEHGLYAANLPVIEGSPKEAHEKVLNITKEAAEKHSGAFLVGLGGEHAVTFPFVKGILSVAESNGSPLQDLGVLQIDAHSDLRNAYEENLLSHASVMRRLRDDLKLETVGVGIRAMGDDEPEYIEENDVLLFQAPFSEKHIPDILDALPENVFITFDVDGLDPSIMPSTGTPVPGGLLWWEALSLLRSVFAEKNVIAMDIVELAPIDGLHAPDFLAAQLLYKCIAYNFCL